MGHKSTRSESNAYAWRGGQGDGSSALIADRALGARMMASDAKNHRSSCGMPTDSAPVANDERAEDAHYGTYDGFVKMTYSKMALTSRTSVAVSVPSNSRSCPELPPTDRACAQQTQAT